MKRNAMKHIMQATNPVSPAHFIVHHAHYKQYPGYGVFCAEICNRLLKEGPIKNVGDLMQKIAGGMRDKEHKREIANHFLKLDFLQRKQACEKWDFSFTFGTAGDDEYGKFLYEPEYEAHGHRIVTPVNYSPQYDKRGYLATLSRLYPDQNPEDMTLRFSYRAPDGSLLPLMKIGKYDTLEVNEADESEKAWLGKMRDAYAGVKFPPGLMFMHPRITPAMYTKLVECLQPLYDTAVDLSRQPESREDALMELYWLLAQSTPVALGGSAFAKMVAVYTAKHAAIEIPYMKAGHDLWAEAALRPLNDFKRAWRENDFFDRTLTKESILEWQARHIANDEKYHDSPASKFVNVGTLSGGRFQGIEGK